MIQPKLNLKTAVSDAEAAEDKKLTKQLLMASCTGDFQGFPQLWDIKSRLNCYNNNYGEVNVLNAFWNSLRSAVNQIFILDAYFLTPEFPSSADEAKLISERILVIIGELEEVILGSAGGLEVKILTDSPYSKDKEKELEMLASFKEVEELGQELGQQGNAGVKLSVCLELTNKFNCIHDRFAIIDNELWHFGGTVGGFNSKLSAASRGWDAAELNAIKFFDEVWQECVR